MSPERFEELVSEFRDLIVQANRTRDELRVLLDDLRSTLEGSGYLRGKAGDDQTSKRPNLTLVESEPSPVDILDAPM